MLQFSILAVHFHIRFKKRKGVHLLPMMKKIVSVISRLLYGRYGIDKLSLHILYLSILLSFINGFFRTISLNIITTLLLIVSLLRIFSKNYNQRRSESTKWENFILSVRNFFCKCGKRLRDLPHYKYYTCMNCSQTLRVPRKKGTIEIRCPKCGYSFRGRT